MLRKRPRLTRTQENSVKINRTRKGAKESNDNPRGEPIGWTCKNKGGGGEANKGKNEGRNIKTTDERRSDGRTADNKQQRRKQKTSRKDKKTKIFDTTWKANKKGRSKTNKEKKTLKKKYKDYWGGSDMLWTAQKTSKKGVSEVKHVVKRWKIRRQMKSE